jgi:hypothetical protein
MRALPLAGTFIVVTVAYGCHDHAHDDGPDADEYFYDCEAPQGATVFATDESFRTLVNKEAAGAVMKNDAKAPHLRTPMAGAPLLAAAAPEIAFDVTTASRTLGSTGGALARACPRLAPRTAFPAPRTTSSGSRVGRGLRGVFSFVGSAHAHCRGVSGWNYLLRITDGDTPVYTAMLSVKSFTPTQAVWQRSLDGRAGRTLTITILAANFANGSIVEGPYAPTAPPTFVVGP